MKYLSKIRIGRHVLLLNCFIMLSAFSCYDYEISAKIENRTDFDLLLIQGDTALGHQTSDYTYTIPAKSSFDFA